VKNEGALALGMAASVGLAGRSAPHWPLLLLGLVGAGMSITALSWNGVLLAEAARLAPEGVRGSATGGVLSFGQIGALLMPLRGLDRQRWLTTSASEREAPLQRMKLRIFRCCPV
jgi:hypothetical protein